MNEFEKLLVDLRRTGVEFILVGGMAVALAGYVRATEDVDILIRVDEENVVQLLSCLERFEESVADELHPEDFALEEGAIRVVGDFPLDVFTVMSGNKYGDLLPLTDKHGIEGTTVTYLNAEGLIKLKSESLRAKDQLDVRVLEEILREQDREGS